MAQDDLVPELVDAVVAAGSLSRLSQPVLQVDELELRPWRSTDAPLVVAAYAEPSIQRWHVRSMTTGEAQSWLVRWSRRWEEETGAGWAFTTDGALAGQVSLRTLSLAEGLAEVSY